MDLVSVRVVVCSWIDPGPSEGRAIVERGATGRRTFKAAYRGLSGWRRM
ncbi:hypothetical protein E1H18_3810 [Caulobacter sp. RHG1]|nr:hypothetical protein [Caulobacter sp. RHG1]